jgi:hypothetical protein
VDLACTSDLLHGYLTSGVSYYVWLSILHFMWIYVAGMFANVATIGVSRERAVLLLEEAA